MIRSRAKAEELISRSIDNEEPLPEWLESQIQSDQHLRDFYRRALQVAGRLRREADSWVDQCHSQHNAGVADNLQCSADNLSYGSSMFNSASAQRYHGDFWSWMSALTATGLLAAVGLWTFSVWDRSDPSKTVTSNEAVTVDNLVAEKEKQLLFSTVLHSTLGALQIVNSTLTEKVIGESFDRAVQGVPQDTVVSEADPSAVAVDGQADSQRVSLDAKQLQLIREFKQTNEYLVHTFPKQALKIGHYSLD